MYQCTQVLLVCLSSLNWHNYLISLLATNTYEFAQSEYDPSGDLNAPPRTGLQIFMSREIKGWPLYTIVIALGQVS